MIIRHKIGILYISKKLITGIILVSGAIIIIAIIMIIYAIKPLPLARFPAEFGRFYPTIEEIRRLTFNFFFFTFILPSILCIFTFTPIGLVISRRLKKITSVYVKKKFINNEDIFKLNRVLKSKSKYPIMKDYWQSPGNPII